MPPPKIVLAPLERLAGQPYPDVSQIRYEAQDPYDFNPDMGDPATPARIAFLRNVVTLAGLRQAFKDRGEEITGTTYPETTPPNSTDGFSSVLEGMQTVIERARWTKEVAWKVAERGLAKVLNTSEQGE